MTEDQEPEIKLVGIVCSCGRTHQTFEEWQKCPMALIPRPLEPWWRNKSEWPRGPPMPPPPIMDHRPARLGDVLNTNRKKGNPMSRKHQKHTGFTQGAGRLAGFVLLAMMGLILFGMLISTYR